MDCQTARKWLSPYLDSELETAKTFEITEHLRTCEGCRRRFDAERQVDDMMRDRLGRESMPPPLWSQLRREVNRAHMLQKLRPIGFVALAACLVIAAMLFVMPGRGGRDSQFPEVFAGQWKPYVNESLPPDHVLQGTAIAAALRNDYGLAYSTDKGDTHGHPVHVIGARRVMFGNQPAMELRVTCCGRLAVITMLHKWDAAKLPADLRELADEAAGRSVMRDGVHVRVDRIGDAEFFIASEHYLKGLAGVMRQSNKA